MASSMSASHLIFPRRFLQDLHYLASGPAILRNDNMGAVHLSSFTYNHPNTKHINLRIYYLRELVASKSRVIRIPRKSLTSPLSVIPYFLRRSPRRLGRSVGFR
jgi:hypothetical protein